MVVLKNLWLSTYELYLCECVSRGARLQVVPCTMGSNSPMQHRGITCGLSERLCEWEMCSPDYVQAIS